MTALEMDKLYTADEYPAMTDLTGCYEFMDGVVYDMSPAPTLEHQVIAFKIVRQIADLIDANKRQCEVFMNLADVKLYDRNVVCPDVFVGIYKDSDNPLTIHIGEK